MTTPAPSAMTWQAITGPGQVQVGDKLRFNIGDKSYSEKAKQILHAGTDKEEVIYDKGRNYYFITAMIVSGFSNHKNVERLAASQPVAAAPAIKSWQDRALGMELNGMTTFNAMKAEIADLRAALQQRQAPAPEWRCFHCHDSFTDPEEAALHFGTSQVQSPACTLDAKYLRELEAEVRRYREEDTDLHREIAGFQPRLHAARQRAEEEGYARGLKDAQQAEAAPHLVPAPMSVMIDQCKPMQDAAMDEARKQYGHGVTRSSIVAVIKAALAANPYAQETEPSPKKGGAA